MELETTQVTQLIKWLEEERRKDKAQLAVLQERLAGQANEIAEQNRRLQELENALKSTQMALVGLQLPERVLAEFKAELLALLDRREDDRKKADRESDRLRALEVEALQRQLTEIKKELPRIGRLEDEVPSRRAEAKRLSDLMQQLEVQVEAAAQVADERTRGVPYLEEGRRQDNRRLANVEQEIITQLKKIDTFFGKLQLLEDATSKIPPRFDPILIRLAEQDKALTQLRASGFQVQQQVKAFEANIEKLREQIGSHADLVTRLREQALINQRAEAGLQAFQETLRQRSTELSEVERLFEERVKRLQDEFQAEAEKRWSKQHSKGDERWHEHDRIHRLQEERVAVLEAAPAPLQNAIGELRAEYDKLVKRLFDAIAGMIETDRSTLPMVAVPPAHTPEDGLGIPAGIPPKP